MIALDEGGAPLRTLVALLQVVASASAADAAASDLEGAALVGGGRGLGCWKERVTAGGSEGGSEKEAKVSTDRSAAARVHRPPLAWRLA